MSIYEKSQPAAQHRFREMTEKRASAVGVVFPTFRCRICGEYRPAVGRKRISRHARDGFMCAQCAACQRETKQ